eukprot:3403353-Amphidinium_carterae.1
MLWHHVTVLAQGPHGSDQKQCAPISLVAELFGAVHQTLGVEAESIAAAALPWSDRKPCGFGAASIPVRESVAVEQGA